MAGLYNLGLVMEELSVTTDFRSSEEIQKVWETMLSNIRSDNTEVVKIAARSMQKLTQHSSCQSYFS